MSILESVLLTLVAVSISPREVATMPGFQFTAGGVGTGAGFQIGASTPNTAAGAGGLSFSSTPSTSQPLGGLSGLSGMGGLRGGGLTAPGGGLGTPTAGSTGTGGLSLTMGTPKSHFGTTPAPTQFSAPAFPVSGTVSKLLLHRSRRILD